jgi:hypothetical protein
MNIKLANYSLRKYFGNEDEAKQGDFVCPSNGASSVGRIVDIKLQDEDDVDWEGNTYTILWCTGRKKGKRSDHKGHTLVLLKMYIAEVNKDLAKVTSLIEEAKAFGM